MTVIDISLPIEPGMISIEPWRSPGHPVHRRLLDMGQAQPLQDHHAGLALPGDPEKVTGVP